MWSNITSALFVDFPQYSIAFIIKDFERVEFEGY